MTVWSGSNRNWGEFLTSADLESRSGVRAKQGARGHLCREGEGYFYCVECSEGLRWCECVRVCVSVCNTPKNMQDSTLPL